MGLSMSITGDQGGAVRDAPAHCSFVLTVPASLKASRIRASLLGSAGQQQP